MSCRGRFWLSNISFTFLLQPGFEACSFSPGLWQNTSDFYPSSVVRLRLEMKK